MIEIERSLRSQLQRELFLACITQTCSHDACLTCELRFRRYSYADENHFTGWLRQQLSRQRWAELGDRLGPR